MALSVAFPSHSHAAVRSHSHADERSRDALCSSHGACCAGSSTARTGAQRRGRLFRNRRICGHSWPRALAVADGEPPKTRV